LSMHHIAVDAVSARIITTELSELHNARVQSREPRLVAPRPLREATRQQLAASASPKAVADVAYWTERLRGELPVLRLPEDRPRPPVQTFDGRAHFSAVDAETARALRRLSGAAGATLFMALLAGLIATVKQVTGDDDVIVGVPVSDRPQGGEEVVGFFVNTLPLRVDASGEPSFLELLRRVRAAALEAYDHASAPFESVVRAIRPPRDTSRTPVFQLMAEYKHTQAFQLDLAGVTVTALDAGREVAVTDLAVHLINHDDEARLAGAAGEASHNGGATGETGRSGTVVVHTEYNTNLFDAGTIERIMEHFHSVLRAVAVAPERPIADLTALPIGQAQADQARLVEWQQGASTPTEDSTVVQLVTASAAANPDALAVTDGETSLTYAQLEAAANRRAHWLAASGVGKGSVVAVWLPRSVETIATLLAVLKLGAGYLPLDPSLGTARVRQVLTDSRAGVVVVAGEEPPLPAGVTACRLDPYAESTLPTEPPAEAPEPDDLCYVIYTSGSTGRPKGVAVAHRSLVNLCRWFHRRFEFGPSDRSALVCGQSFDASVVEIWPALTAGASLAIADERTRLDPATLAAWFGDYDVTFTLLPTALGEAVMELPAAEQPPLRTMMVGGDVLRRRPPVAAPYQTVNAYGPTEATVLVSVEPVTPDGAGPIGIGAPIDNTLLLVLDEHGKPVPAGVVGEL
ncbi:MAG: non-ribosomal peptide synthetase, partial [Micromonosporaceae bacterium]